jgi:hypothetical protein
MHLSLEELLEVRAGSGPRDAVEHAASCARCAEELAALRKIHAALTQLPAEAPRRDLFPAVLAQWEAERSHRRWLHLARAVASLAAVVAVAAAVRGGIVAWREAQTVRAAHALLLRSEALERELGSYRSGSVLSGRAARTVMEIEDRLALVDGQLAQLRHSRVPPREALRLWEQRVQLLDALVELHATRGTYAGL